MLKQAHIYVKGDVIGIGFRAWTKIQAKLNSITGWVKNSFNKPDIFGSGGGVEALIQGEEQNTNNMIAELKKGSSVARVDDVEIFWQEPKEILDGFEIKQ